MNDPLGQLISLGVGTISLSDCSFNLEQLITDRAIPVRSAAIWAIGRMATTIDAKHYVVSVKETLVDQSPEIRLLAQTALQRILGTELMLQPILPPPETIGVRLAMAELMQKKGSIDNAFP